MKSKFYSFTLLCFLLLTSVAAFAQKRDKVLNVEVKTNIGVSLAGQAIDIEQTDFEMQYPVATLDADGKCTINAYAGKHRRNRHAGCIFRSIGSGWCRSCRIPGGTWRKPYRNKRLSGYRFHYETDRSC